jgi:hypothetical protein
MPDDPDKPEINTRVYDFCVRAFRTTRKLLKLNIKLHQEVGFEDLYSTIPDQRGYRRLLSVGSRGRVF